MYDDENSHADKKYYQPLRLHNYEVKGPKKNRILSEYV